MSELNNTPVELFENPVVTDIDSDVTARLIGNQFRLERELGAGGMGTVYLATDVLIGRLVAIKFLHSHLLVSEKSVSRFSVEARVIGKLNHPNIIRIQQCSFDQSLPYIVTDYIDGVSIAQRIANQGAMDTPMAVSLMTKVADALEHAHDQGVIHRDLKPSNIHITRDGEDVVVLDFGIAKLSDDNQKDAKALTRTGEMVGTPAYMSPEQLSGKVVDARSDQYSFGCVLYECLTGLAPFTGNTLVEVVTKHLTEELPSHKGSALSKLPVNLQSLILRALSKDPEDRYRSMMELKAALTAIGEPGNDKSGREKNVRAKAGNNKSGNDKAGRDLASNKKSGNNKSGNDKFGNDKAGGDQASRDQSSKYNSGNDKIVLNKPVFQKLPAAVNETSKLHSHIFLLSVCSFVVLLLGFFVFALTSNFLLPQNKSNVVADSAGAVNSDKLSTTETSSSSSNKDGNWNRSSAHEASGQRSTIVTFSDALPGVSSLQASSSRDFYSLCRGTGDSISGDANISDSAMQSLRYCQQLTRLSIPSGDITDSAMLTVRDIVLQRHFDFRFLDISDTKVGIKGLKAISQLTSLQSIALSGLPGLDLNGLKEIWQLPHLSSITLNSNPQLNMKACVEMMAAQPKRMEKICLVGNDCHGALDAISSIPVEALVLSETNLDDSDVAAIAKCRTVRTLDLRWNNKIHLKSLEALTQLKELRSLWVPDSFVPELKQKLKHCQVFNK